MTPQSVSSPVLLRARRDSTSAFTLIELLTVIAIIGILAAIIIPVVGKARAAAGRSQCVSNMRQLSVAMSMFSNEHKNRLVGPVFTGHGPVYDADFRRLQSSRMLGPYMGIAEHSSWSGYRVAPNFSCPTWETQRGIPITPDAAGFSGWWGFLNKSVLMVGGATMFPFGSANSGSPSPGDVQPQLQSAVAEPSTTWMFVEADGQMGPTPGSPVGSSLLNRGVPDNPPHGAYRNAVFFDGHVGRLDFNYKKL